MKRLAISALLLLCGLRAYSQSPVGDLDSLKLQVHGFATQAFIYTTQNNWATTASSDGTAAWTEAVVNLSAEPEPKLRIGVQARYFLLGTYGNEINLDWAQLDYKASEFIGFRAGKVKTPVGLFNEIQDVDPSYLWVLLPQSIYPLPSRNANLAHYGGVLYGQVPLGESFGKLEYRGFAGQRVVDGDDGYLQSTRDAGAVLPNGVSGHTFGGSLRWNTPIPGLLFGASESAGGVGGELDQYSLRGSITTPEERQTYYFGKYDHRRLMLAGEYSRSQLLPVVAFPGVPSHYIPIDLRAFYGMATWRVVDKLSAGLYYSSSIDARAAVANTRYQKDWALAARYDFGSYLYAKVEQHFVDGTEINYSTLDNTNLQPNTRMTFLKLGVSF